MNLKIHTNIEGQLQISSPVAQDENDVGALVQKWRLKTQQQSFKPALLNAGLHAQATGLKVGPLPLCTIHPLYLQVLYLPVLLLAKTYL